MRLTPREAAEQQLRGKYYPGQIVCEMRPPNLPKRLTTKVLGDGRIMVIENPWRKPGGKQVSRKSKRDPRRRKRRRP